MLDLLDVRKLRTLREIALHGTIAAAANALKLTPSAASQHISALERDSGVELLVRTGRSVRLTPAGQRLVEHTERVLEQLEVARIDLSTDPDDIAGELHIAASATTIRAVVAPATARLRQRWPALDLGIIERSAEQALSTLATGTVDIALVYDYDLLPTQLPAGVQLELLLTEPVHAAVPVHIGADGEALELSELANEHWIAPLDGSTGNTFVCRACNQAGFTPEFWALSDDFGSILDLVAAGVGVALVPALGCRDVPPDVAIRELVGPSVQRRVHVATRVGAAGHPTIQAVNAELRTMARRAAASLTPAR
jgi:DNA-binding transcriptional LysR family regulator